jgi:hypothetical protein
MQTKKYKGKFLQFIRANKVTAPVNYNKSLYKVISTKKLRAIQRDPLKNTDKLEI